MFVATPMAQNRGGASGAATLCKGSRRVAASVNTTAQGRGIVLTIL
jgi:hypothetical protein